MSVIHQSLKKASEANAESGLRPPVGPEAGAAALRVIDARPKKSLSRPWLFPLMVFAVMLTASSLIYAYEHDARVQAEAKLSSALNELNDSRAQAAEITRQKEETEKTLGARAETLQSQLKNVSDEKESLVREKQALEFDNLSKEKKNSQLSGQAHRLQMNKLHLLGVVKKLRQKDAPPPAVAVEAAQDPSATGAPQAGPAS